MCHWDVVQVAARLDILRRTQSQVDERTGTAGRLEGAEGTVREFMISSPNIPKNRMAKPIDFHMCWRGYIAPSCSIMLRHESLNVQKSNPFWEKYCAHVWPWLGTVCTQSGGFLQFVTDTGEYEAVDQTHVISMSFTRKVDQISLSFKKNIWFHSGHSKFRCSFSTW